MEIDLGFLAEPTGRTAGSTESPSDNPSFPQQDRLAGVTGFANPSSPMIRKTRFWIGSVARVRRC